MTEDHVIARSWFPANTPPVAKWKVHSCRKCNKEKGDLENDVLGRLAWCLDPGRPDLADIVKRARRATDPRSAKNERDWKHRFNRREAIRRYFIDIQSTSELGILPYFKENFDAGSRKGILIPKDSFDTLVQMWVRGIHLLEIGSIIPSGYEVSVTHADDEVRGQALSGVMEYARVIQKGPGVEVRIFHAKEPAEFGTLCAFNIWDTLKCIAFVSLVA